MTRRIVFDTSTLIGAALRKGSVPYEALTLAAANYEVCANDELIAELRRVLLSSKFDRYLPHGKRVAFIDLFLQHSYLHQRQQHVEALQTYCCDVKDDYLLLLAHSASADTIVTSDEDLIVLNPWNGVVILSPSQFLERESRGSHRNSTTEGIL